VGRAISPATPTFFKVALALASTFAMPLMARRSEAVWFNDIDLITASCRLSSVSITEINGCGICVLRLF